MAENVEGAPGQEGAADAMVEGSVPDDVGELLAVVAFTRHADRTPKQKLKFWTTEPELLKLIHEHGESPREELK